MFTLLFTRGLFSGKGPARGNSAAAPAPAAEAGGECGFVELRWKEWSGYLCSDFRTFQFNDGNFPSKVLHTEAQQNWMKAALIWLGQGVEAWSSAGSQDGPMALGCATEPQGTI